jgi:hypothetical protein
VENAMFGGFGAAWLRILFFCDVTLCQWTNGLQHFKGSYVLEVLEDEDTALPQNLGVQLHVDAVSYPR